MKRSFLWALLLLANASFAAELSDYPKRIVSLNPCLDATLVELVPLDHIAALSHYSRNHYRSTIADLAQQLPITYETAEEVVALKPDLVLTSRHSAIATRNALRRVGIRFELFEVPDSIAGSVEQIRQIARLLGRETEGEALIARIDRTMSDARPLVGQRMITAAVYQPGGLTAGAQTVVGELMHAAGFENVAARYGIDKWRPLSLELLLSKPPEVLLVGETSLGAQTQAEKIVHHRALRALGSDLKFEPYPARLLYCTGPVMINALHSLVAARENALREQLSARVQ